MESLAKAFESILPSEILFTVGVLRASNTEISLVHLKLNQVLKKEQFTSLICWYFRCVAALWSEPCDHLHPVWSEHWHPCNFVFNQIQFSINLWLRVWVTCLHELTRFFGSNQCFISFPLILTMAHPHKQRQCHTTRKESTNNIS